MFPVLTEDDVACGVCRPVSGCGLVEAEGSFCASQRTEAIFRVNFETSIEGDVSSLLSQKKLGVLDTVDFAAVENTELGSGLVEA